MTAGMHMLSLVTVAAVPDHRLVNLYLIIALFTSGCWNTVKSEKIFDLLNYNS